MLGRAVDIKTVPFFWSAMFGKTLRYAGRGATLRLQEKGGGGAGGFKYVTPPSNDKGGKPPIGPLAAIDLVCL